MATQNKTESKKTALQLLDEALNSKPNIIEMKPQVIKKTIQPTPTFKTTTTITPSALKTTSMQTMFTAPTTATSKGYAPQTNPIPTSIQTQQLLGVKPIVQPIGENLKLPQTLVKPSQLSGGGVIESIGKELQSGAKSFTDRLKELGAGTLNVGSGLLETAARLPQLKTPDQFILDKILGEDKNKELAAEQIGQPLRNLSKVLQTGAQNLTKDITYNNQFEQRLGQVNQAIPTTLATASASTVGGTPLALATMGATTFGQTASQIEKEGGTKQQQLLGGLGGAISETIPEMFGLNASMKVFKSTGIKQFVTNSIKSALTNPTQEAATEVLNWVNRLVVLDKDAKLSGTDVVNSAIDGALMSAVFAGAGVTSNVLSGASKTTAPITREVLVKANEEVKQKTGVDALKEIDSIPLSEKKSEIKATIEEATKNGSLIMPLNLQMFADRIVEIKDEAIRNEINNVIDLAKNENTIEEASEKIDLLADKIAPENIGLYNDFRNVVKKLNTNKLAQTVFGQADSEEFVRRIYNMPKFSKWELNNTDFRRVMEKLKTAGLDTTNLEDTFYKSKEAYYKMMENLTQTINSFEKLGIKEGSKESAAMQQYGEGQKRIFNADGKQVSYSEYTLNDLKREFPTSWKTIVEAEKQARKMYDDLIDQINVQLVKTYPDVEKKIEEAKKKRSELITEVRRLTDNQKAAHFGFEQQIKKYTDFNKAHPNAKSAIADNLRKIAIIENRASEYKRKFDYSMNKKKQAVNDIADALEKGEFTRKKRVPKRKDYFMHFTDTETGLFKDIKEALRSDIEIDPELSTMSEYTKPNAAFNQTMLARGNNKAYTADAIGGLKRYVPLAARTINLTEPITKSRAMSKLLTEVAVANGRNTDTNPLIEYFDSFANSLAGKTHSLDRTVFNIGLNRKYLKLLNILSSRVAKNSLLFNMSTAAKQVLNVPNFSAVIKNPKYTAKALTQLNENITNPLAPINTSMFMRERLHERKMRQYDTKLMDKLEGFGALPMEIVDETMTKLYWQSFYNKAVDLKVSNPIKYADNETAKIVGARGLGEKPYLEQSQIYRLVAPFMTEVSNQWRVLGDLKDKKDVKGFIIFLISSMILNNLLKGLTGSDGSLDLLTAIYKGQASKDTPLDKLTGVIGGVTGEVLGNMPFGSQIASLYDVVGSNQFLNNLGIEVPTTEEFFGSNDPTRFGGGLLALSGIEDPLYKLLLPFGGSQVKKSVESLQALDVLPQFTVNNLDISKNKGLYSESNGEVKLKTPISTNPQDIAKMMVFGKYSNPKVVEYFDKGLTPLSAKQTTAYDELVKNGYEPLKLFDAITEQKKIKLKEDKLKLLTKYYGSKKSKEIYDMLYPVTYKQKEVETLKQMGYEEEELQKALLEQKDKNSKSEKIAVLNKYYSAKEAQEIYNLLFPKKK